MSFTLNLGGVRMSRVMKGLLFIILAQLIILALIIIGLMIF